MGLVSSLKRWINMIFDSKATKEFGVENVNSDRMTRFIANCWKIYQSQPPWLDDNDNIKTVNFAKIICEEIARLSTLAIGITIDGSPRAEWLQGQIDSVYFQLRQWVEYASAYGTVVLKPNGENVDVVLPSEFIVTEQDNGKVTGIVFLDDKRVDKKFYTRLEYHRFVDDYYMITNKCYLGSSKYDMEKEIAIEDTPWKNLQEEIAITNLERPLYGVLKMPNANSIDIGSAMALPVFSDALEELKDLDIAYSRNAKEILNSDRIVLLDADRMIPAKAGGDRRISENNVSKNRMKLPEYVRVLDSSDSAGMYQEINPNLNTAVRLEGINALLSQIGFKCGFSNGYFVFNEKTGMITATQVEADDRRTIQLIKDVRDQLECAMSDLIYALDKFADLYGLAPLGLYEVTFDFGDITYNREEDRQRWWGYVQAGKVPAWRYFMKFEGMSEEDARAMVEEAQPKEPTLFAE